MRSSIAVAGWVALGAATLSGCFNDSTKIPDAGPVVDAGHPVGIPTCFDDTRGCSGNTPRLCLDGGWVAQAACSGDVPLCSFGLCVCADGTSSCLDAGPVRDAGPPPICFPATRGCESATTPEQCVDGGWVALAACSGEEPICTAGACTCTEGAQDCVGVTPRTCTGGVWVAQADCSGSTPSCDQGTCVCTDGGVSCQGNTPLVCVGTTFVPQTPCSGSTPACSEGACVCAEGVASCSASGVPQVCTAGAEVAQAACTGATPACDAGQCTCAEGEGTCVGTTPSLCVGGSYHPQAACSGSTPLCSLGLCVASAALSVSTEAVCTVADGGLMLCWGFNGNGQLGDSTTNSRPSPGYVVTLGLGTDGGPDAGFLDQVAGVATGGLTSYAVRSDGTVVSWGANYDLQLGEADAGYQEDLPKVIPGLTGVVEVVANTQDSCALLGDGTVECWGYGGSNLLGTGNGANEPVPVPVPNLQGVVELAMGPGQTCARIDDGTVQCWGTNYELQAGQAAGGIVSSPTTVAGVSDAVSISAGNEFSCAVSGDGGVVNCWGFDNSEVLGVSFGLGFGETATPSPVGLSGAIKVAAGDHHVCALKSDGTVWCWGGNDVGQLGLGTTVNIHTPTQVPGLSGISELAAGGSVTCARSSGGQLWCWGDDSDGELGNGVTGSRPQPVPVSGLSGAAEVSAGGNFSCALLDGGTTACWGSDADGELGDGLSTDQATATPVAGVSGVVAISAGGFHACALLDDGTLTCWGSNLAGQTQTAVGGTGPWTVSGVAGAIAVQASPSQLLNIPSESACQNECGYTCALLGGGSMVCWGDNMAGQLANGGFGTTQQPPSAGVLPAPATELALGAMHGCALLNDGTVACWGDNSVGQLGDGTYASRAAGSRVPGLSGVVSVASGEEHTCALASSADGGGSGVWCWGDDNYGQLGTYDYSTDPSPVQAQTYGFGGATPIQVVAGLYSTCALMSDGTAQCWGDNGDAELGAPFAGGPYPDQVASLTTAVALTGGGEVQDNYGSYNAHACALLANSTVECWGSDEYGQIGDGLFGYVATPYQVPLP